MSTIVSASDPQAVPWVIDALGRGALVAIPTDTVYGLAARLDRPDAVEALYRVKGRPDGMPIPVLISRLDLLPTLTTGTLSAAEDLAARFWPGPLTIVVPGSRKIPERVSANTGTVGLRMPDHPIALEIIEGCGGALAVTSANRSGEPSLCRASDVERTFTAAVELVLDSGATPGGHASTVVSLVSGRPVVLRRGPVGEDEINATLTGSLGPGRNGAASR